MEDLDTLARDFGFVSRGKSNPMRSAQPDRRPIDDPSFSDVFGGPAKYTPSSNSNSNDKHSLMSDFGYDSVFNSSARKTNNSSRTSSIPVYDKPVYDDDIFDGLPGLKGKSASSTARFDNGVFASISSPPSSTSANQDSDFDELLGNLGRNEKAGKENIRSNSAKSSSSSKGFDDLLDGFGSRVSAAINRPVPESKRGSIPVGGPKHESVSDDPFVVLESSSSHQSSSSGVFTDPLEEITSLGKSRSARAEASSGGGGGFDDLDPLNGLGKPVDSFYPGTDERGKERSPSRSATLQSTTTGEQKVNSSSFRYSPSNMEKKLPVDNFQEPPLFDMPNVSTDFQKSLGQTASSPQYFETSPQVHMFPTSSGHQFDDIWLTVSEVPLFTQTTASPPPSRPPPQTPRQTSRLESGYFSSSSRKNGDEFTSPSNYSQHSHSPKLARPAAKDHTVSQFDDLEDFAAGRSQNSIDESANLYFGEETNSLSAATASAAAMKDAMEKAEAKFRHAREVRDREYAKATRNKESVLLEKDDQDGIERELKETEERLERERNHKEDEEREQKRLQREMERSREIEREKGRQAVERATRETRERSAIQARERAAAEARLKTERASVQKVNAEARERAGRVAVQRVQAEARERAAAEAKERAEKAAAAEAREKELRAKASIAKAEDARLQAERAAVNRAASEARERAATAAAAKMNQQRNDDDLDSIFSTGRASSAPKGGANSTNPFFDQQFQNKGVSEAAKRASSSSSGASSNMKRPSSTTNIVDDLSSIFGAAPSSVELQEVEGETEERRRARLDRHQRTQERAAKAVAEKNQRDLQAQKEQEERHDKRRAARSSFLLRT